MKTAFVCLAIFGLLAVSHAESRLGTLLDKALKAADLASSKGSSICKATEEMKKKCTTPSATVERDQLTSSDIEIIRKTFTDTKICPEKVERLINGPLAKLSEGKSFAEIIEGSFALSKVLAKDSFDMASNSTEPTTWTAIFAVRKIEWEKKTDEPFSVTWAKVLSLLATSDCVCWSFDEKATGPASETGYLTEAEAEELKTLLQPLQNGEEGTNVANALKNLVAGKTENEHLRGYGRLLQAIMGSGVTTVMGVEGKYGHTLGWILASEVQHGHLELNTVNALFD